MVIRILFIIIGISLSQLGWAKRGAPTCKNPLKYKVHVPCKSLERMVTKSVSEIDTQSIIKGKDTSGSYTLDNDKSCTPAQFKKRKKSYLEDVAKIDSQLQEVRNNTRAAISQALDVSHREISKKRNEIYKKRDREVQKLTNNRKKAFAKLEARKKEIPKEIARIDKDLHELYFYKVTKYSRNDFKLKVAELKKRKTKLKTSLSSLSDKRNKIFSSSISSISKVKDGAFDKISKSRMKVIKRRDRAVKILKENADKRIAELEMRKKNLWPDWESCRISVPNFVLKDKVEGVGAFSPIPGRTNISWGP